MRKFCRRRKTGVVDCLAGDFLASPCFLIEQPDGHRNGRFAIRWCTGLPNFQLLTRAPTRFVARPSTTTVLRSQCRGLFPRAAE